VFAAVALAVSTDARSPTARKRAIARAMQEVAHYLGNTPAVCRSSYVDPRIVDRYRAGTTIRTALVRAGEPALGADEEARSSMFTQGAIELAVLELLEDAPWRRSWREGAAEPRRHAGRRRPGLPSLRRQGDGGAGYGPEADPDESDVLVRIGIATPRK